MGETQLNAKRELLDACHKAYDEYDQITKQLSVEMGDVRTANTMDLDDEGMLTMALIVAKNYYEDAIQECKRQLSELRKEK